MDKKIVVCWMWYSATAMALLNISPVKLSADNIASSDVLQSWATGNNLIVGFVADTGFQSNVSVGVFELANGQITKVASQPFDARRKLVYTNGEWFGAQEASDLTVFRLDGGNVVDVTQITDFCMFMVPDGSMIVYNSEMGYLTTLLRTGELWTMLDQVIPANISLEYAIVPVWANNDTLIFHENTGIVSFYTRANNGGWTFSSSFDSESVPSLESYILTYNGVDTVFLIAPVLQYPGAIRYGHLLILTRDNDRWVRTLITADDLPVTQPYPYIGYNSYGVVNKDMFVTGTPYDKIPLMRGLSTPVPIGSMFFFQRQADNTWKTIAKAELDVPGYFGSPALVTSSHVVTVLSSIDSTNLGNLATFYGIPTCTFEPIDVTCVDGQLESCDFDPLSIGAYVIHNGAECGEVNVTLIGVKAEGNTRTISFNFEKGSISSATCSATWSCSATPGAATTPVKKASNASTLSVCALIFLGLLAWF